MTRLLLLFATSRLAASLQPTSPRFLRGSALAAAPTEPVTSKLWKGVGVPGFVYPERRAGGAVAEAAATRDPDLAICLSGGGERAALLALGNVRGLRELGIHQQAGYQCSNSGASWFNTASAFQQHDSIEKFLGPVIAPEDLTKNVARKQQKSFGKSVRKANFLSDMKAKFFWDKINPLKFGQKTPSYRAWAECIGNAFLAKYGLNGDEKCFGPAEGPDGPVDVHRARADHPYPVVVCTTKPPGDELVFESFEWTPAYCGYQKAGGVLQEPIGANAPEVTVVAAGDPATVESRPDTFVPLPVVAGTSSSFVAAGLPTTLNLPLGYKIPLEETSRIGWGLFGQSELYAAHAEGDDIVSAKVPFADGGGNDNLAIFPALRRGCRKLIILDANEDAPKDKYYIDLKTYFGCAGVDASDEEQAGASGMNVTGANINGQVFEEEAWDALSADLRAKSEAGEPCVHSATLRVLQNERQGIAGGYDVDTVWILNSKQSAWFDALPEETRKKLTKAGDKEQNMEKLLTFLPGGGIKSPFPADNHLKNLPYLSTTDVAMDGVAVGLLSQHATFHILQCKPELDALLAK